MGRRDHGLGVRWVTGVIGIFEWPIAISAAYTAYTVAFIGVATEGGGPIRTGTGHEFRAKPMSS